MKYSNLNRLILINICQCKERIRQNMSYPANCYKYLTSSVFVDWLVNDIVELELSFCINIFHWKGQIEQNMSLKSYNILRR